jgi:hypothetical protein
MGVHINEKGQFQSDKYPTCPPGKVPLSVNDASAQDLLWEYAQRRRKVDAEFTKDLEDALCKAKFPPPIFNVPRMSVERERELRNIAVECGSVSSPLLIEALNCIATERALSDKDRKIANTTIVQLRSQLEKKT